MKKTDYKALWKANKRAFALWNQYCPGFMRDAVLYGVLTGATPFVTVYLSARVLTALTAGEEGVWRLIGISLAVTFVLHCLTKASQARYLAMRSMRTLTLWQILGEKMSGMDFVDAESRRVNDLNSQILQYNNYANLGASYFVELLRDVASNLTALLCGVGLSVTLFTSKSPAGAFAFLNHPLMIPLIAALIIVVSVWSGKLTAAPEKAELANREEAALGNRMFSVYGLFAYETSSRAPDIRVYRQEPIAQSYAAQDNIFTPAGKMAHLMRGKLGLEAGAGKGISGIMTGLIYLFVCLKAYAGAFGIGAVTQYVGAVTGIFSATAELAGDLGQLKENTEALSLLFEFLDIPNNMYQGSLTTEKRSDRQYEIEFRDVSFRYPGSDQYALRHVNVKFRVGETLAVVGPNGSGKTTFIKLLCRLYDPDEGEILLNGINIRKYRYDDYMDIFSVVFQDFKLFALPLGENVASGRDVDAARAENVLRMAGFGDRLDTLPKGLKTSLYKALDKDGVDVSGGEAQKIAIARALYRDSPFLILDEPTAALDPRAESEIYSRLNDIVSDKTAIYISHRLSSCRFCDEIMVFDGGSIVQKGTHEKLLEDEAGLYRRLWDAQAQYYTESA